MGTMKSFKELNEAFDKPLPYDSDIWYKTDSLMYSFKLSDKDYYRVVIYKSEDLAENEYQVTFEHLKNEKQIYDPSPGKFGTMNAFSTSDAIKVFSTVIAIIKEHLSDHPNIKKLSFSAKPTEYSRFKLYQKLSIMAARKLKWNLYQLYIDDGYIDNEVFFLSKNKMPKFQEFLVKT
jgi:hypothetical protein